MSNLPVELTQMIITLTKEIGEANKSIAVLSEKQDNSFAVVENKIADVKNDISDVKDDMLITSNVVNQIDSRLLKLEELHCAEKKSWFTLENAKSVVTNQLFLKVCGGIVIGLLSLYGVSLEWIKLVLSLVGL